MAAAARGLRVGDNHAPLANTALRQRRRDLLAEVETLRATKNAVSKEMPNLTEDDRKVKILEMKEVDIKQEQLEQTLQGALTQPTAAWP